MKRLQKPWYLFFIGIALYTLLIFVMVAGLNRFETGNIRFLFALLPIPAFILAIVGSIRAIWQMDELVRRIQTEAFTLAAIVAALGSFSYGFLELVGFPKINAFFFFPLVCLLHVIFLPIVRRRYE